MWEHGGKGKIGDKIIDKETIYEKMRGWGTMRG
jgi:hypothetical protein